MKATKLLNIILTIGTVIVTILSYVAVIYAPQPLVVLFCGMGVVGMWFFLGYILGWNKSLRKKDNKTSIGN